MSAAIAIRSVREARRPAPQRVAASVLVATLLVSCAATRPPLGEQPFAPPRVVRGSWIFRRTETLWPVGDLGVAPAPTLAGALERVTAARAADRDAARRLFVLVRESGGWRARGYESARGRDVELRDLETPGLPLAADPDAPQTYFVDVRGAVGRLVFEEGRFVVRPVGAEIPQEPVLARPVVTGFVAPDVSMRNHATNVEWSPTYVFRPGSKLRALTEGLAWSSAHLRPEIPIRAIGSRHSWSPVTATEGVTVLPDDCTGVSQVAPATDASGPLFRVLAGTTIRELNAALAERDLAIPYLGGYDGQTVGGVLATGTHGSVLALGPLADLIRSIDLVRFDGHVLRIEPARQPIHDAAEGPAVERRVDDDLFDAARIGLGCFGVIHSLVLEVAPKYWLREVRTVVGFDEVRERCRGGRIQGLFEPRDYVLARLRDRDHADYVETRPPQDLPRGGGFAGHPTPAFHFELLWNPYGDGKTLVTTRHWVDATMRAEFERSEPAEFARPPRRDLLRFLDPRTVRFSRPGLSELLAAIVGEPVTRLVERLQRDAPRSVPELIDASIEALDGPRGYVRRSYDVFNIGDAANRLPSLSATISVPLRDDLWLRAADLIHRTSEDLLRSGFVETAPISLRFVAGSSAHLADPDAVCKFELIFAGNGETARAQANRIVAAHYFALRAELGDVVRLHFGQLIPPGTLDRAGSDGRFPVETAYPRYGRWRALRDALDPSGRGLTPWLRSILPEASGPG